MLPDTSHEFLAFHVTSLAARVSNALAKGDVSEIDPKYVLAKLGQLRTELDKVETLLRRLDLGL